MAGAGAHPDHASIFEKLFNGARADAKHDFHGTAFKLGEPVQRVIEAGLPRIGDINLTNFSHLEEDSFLNDILSELFSGRENTAMKNAIAKLTAESPKYFDTPYGFKGSHKYSVNILNSPAAHGRPKEINVDEIIKRENLPIKVFRDFIGGNILNLVIDSTSVKLFDLLKSLQQGDDAEQITVNILKNRETINDSSFKLTAVESSSKNKVKIKLYYDSKADELQYSTTTEESTSYTDMFFSNYAFKLSPLKNTVRGGLITSSSITTKIIGDKLSITLTNPGVQNSIAHCLDLLRKALFGQETAFPRKRSGDWLMCLSCLDILRPYKDVTNGHNPEIGPNPRFTLVTHDRILLWYALLMGVDVFFTCKDAHAVGGALNSKKYLLYFKAVKEINAEEQALAAAAAVAAGVAAGEAEKQAFITRANEYLRSALYKKHKIYIHQYIEEINIERKKFADFETKLNAANLVFGRTEITDIIRSCLFIFTFNANSFGQEIFAFRDLKKATTVEQAENMNEVQKRMKALIKQYPTTNSLVTNIKRIKIIDPTESIERLTLPQKASIASLVTSLHSNTVVAFTALIDTLHKKIKDSETKAIHIYYSTLHPVEEASTIIPILTAAIQLEEGEIENDDLPLHERAVNHPVNDAVINEEDLLDAAFASVEQLYNPLEGSIKPLHAKKDALIKLEQQQSASVARAPTTIGINFSIKSAVKYVAKRLMFFDAQEGGNSKRSREPATPPHTGAKTARVGTPNAYNVDYTAEKHKFLIGVYLYELDLALSNLDETDPDLEYYEELATQLRTLFVFCVSLTDYMFVIYTFLPLKLVLANNIALSAVGVDNASPTAKNMYMYYKGSENIINNYVVYTGIHTPRSLHGINNIREWINAILKPKHQALPNALSKQAKMSELKQKGVLGYAFKTKGAVNSRRKSHKKVRPEILPTGFKKEWRNKKSVGMKGVPAGGSLSIRQIRYTRRRR